MTDAGSRPWVIVYDGECEVCIRTVNALRDSDRDGRFELVAYQSPGLPDRFPDITRQEFEEAVQLIGPEGERWSGSDAVERILRLVPRTGARILSWLFRIPLVRPIARRAYRVFSRHRGIFGCGDHCPIV